MRLKNYKNLNRALINQAVLKFSKSLPGGIIVLDVGAGNGSYRPYFTKQAYWAIDRGLESGSLAGLSVCGDINAMPFPGASVDAALCVEVLEHLPETAVFLTELARILKPGAKLLLTTPLCFGEHMAPYDYYRFTRYGLKKLAEENGFDIQRLEPRGGFFALAAYLLGRLPDEVARGREGSLGLKLLKPLLRMTCTYLASPLLHWLDRLDKEKRFTLGYSSLLIKR